MARIRVRLGLVSALRLVLHDKTPVGLYNNKSLYYTGMLGKLAMGSFTGLWMESSDANS